MQRLIVPEKLKIERIVFEMGLMADSQTLAIQHRQIPHLELIRVQNLRLEFLDPRFSNCGSCYTPQSIFHPIAESLHLLHVKVVLLDLATPCALLLSILLNTISSFSALGR